MAGVGRKRRCAAETDAARDSGGRRHERLEKFASAGSLVVGHVEGAGSRPRPARAVDSQLMVKLTPPSAARSKEQRRSVAARLKQGRERLAPVREKAGGRARWRWEESGSTGRRPRCLAGDGRRARGRDAGEGDGARRRRRRARRRRPRCRVRGRSAAATGVCVAAGCRQERRRGGSVGCLPEEGRKRSWSTLVCSCLRGYG